MKILEEKTMTLGDMFKAIVREEEEAKLKAALEADEAKARQRAKRRESRESLMNAIEGEIYHKIRSGKKPAYKVHSTDMRAWVNFCRLYETRPVEDRDVFDATAAWLKAQGLRFSITDEHDGMGQDNWLMIGVEALPDPEVEAD